MRLAKPAGLLEPLVAGDHHYSIFTRCTLKYFPGFSKAARFAKVIKYFVCWLEVRSGQHY